MKILCKFCAAAMVPFFELPDAFELEGYEILLKAAYECCHCKKLSREICIRPYQTEQRQTETKVSTNG